MEKDDKLIKSHIYPKSMIKNWLKDILNNYQDGFKINKIDLTNKNFKENLILSTKDIDKYIKEKDFFYINLPEKYIEKYEQKWNIIEDKFYKIYYEIKKTMLDKSLQWFEKNKRIEHNIINNKQNRKYIEDFVILTLFRCEQMYKPIFKMINQYNQENMNDLSELINTITLQTTNNYDINFNTIKKDFKIEEYNWYLHLGVTTSIFFNPPYFRNAKTCYIFPILGLGYILFLKKNNWFYINSSKNEWKLLNNDTIKDINPCIIQKNSIFLWDSKEQPNITCFLQTLLIEFWIDNVGYKAGNTYSISFNKNNNNKIDSVMKCLEEFNYFEKRKKYLNNPLNFNETNTVRVFSLKEFEKE